MRITANIEPWYNEDVKRFYLRFPNGIGSIQQRYCNVTVAIPDGKKDPYPLRFECRRINNRDIEIELNTDFPKWADSAANLGDTYDKYQMTIYLRFYINGGAPTGTTANI